MRLPWRRADAGHVLTVAELQSRADRTSLRNFVVYLGPALMVSLAYMDPGNYGTDMASGSIFKYDLIWAIWLASGMAMILQYLSGKLGIASGHSLPEMVRKSLVRRYYVIPYWLAAEAAAAATDLAEYLGTVIALYLLFGIPLIYSAIFGALDVLLILTMMDRRFRVVERFFMIFVSILVIGFLYQLAVIKPSLNQIAYHSVVPGPFTSVAILLVVGNIGATVMPHALFVHSWLTKHKMGLTGKKIPGATDNNSEFTMEMKVRTRIFHKWETIVFLSIAGVVNVGILLVAIPLTNFSSIPDAVKDMRVQFGSIFAIVFALTLLSSGLTSSTLGTIAGQIIMEGLIGKRLNVWLRRIITRFVNVFPTTLAILAGIDPLRLLVYSQVVLSLLIPLPMIPLVYYTSKKKFMGPFVNRRITIIAALISAGLILAFNTYFLFTLI
ncbi:MAG TPA: Nramp family divalent metal transporter [Candidatus Bathyarchaeia archaeon]|nr:Nramp family divalent metal transporter [Candidatus Bathyarchaeia archaeon]